MLLVNVQGPPNFVERKGQKWNTSPPYLNYICLLHSLWENVWKGLCWRSCHIINIITNLFYCQKGEDLIDTLTIHGSHLCITLLFPTCREENKHQFLLIVTRVIWQTYSSRVISGARMPLGQSATTVDLKDKSKWASKWRLLQHGWHGIHRVQWVAGLHTIHHTVRVKRKTHRRVKTCSLKRWYTWVGKEWC